MGSSCDTIISDQGISIRTAIADLSSENVYDGQHVYDLYHFYKSLNIKGT